MKPAQDAAGLPSRVPLASRRRQGKLRRGGQVALVVPDLPATPAAPLPPHALRGCQMGSRKMCGKATQVEKRAARNAEKRMEKKEIQELRIRVPCSAVLEKAGFVIDLKESTLRAVKYRRDSEIIIMIHDGHGWFDPLSEAKGDVFSLVAHLDGGGFRAARDRVAELIGYVPQGTARRTVNRVRGPNLAIAERWNRQRRPWPGSQTWHYLSEIRLLPSHTLHAAISQNAVREGPYGSMWAAHTNDLGAITGWEERGPEWRGFSTGGTKVLFRLGRSVASRLCVTEAAIDAMSLAAFEGLRDGTLYLSTGGGWSPATDAALRMLAAPSGVQLVAATDNNAQGDTFADRLRTLAEEAGCGWQRLRPPADDWNEALQEREAERRKRRGEREGVPHSRQPHQGKLRPA
ncbi:Uncharacterised protein [Brucella anthropi]|jgi:hypothetical protein|nr:hypothetical protein RP007_04729 [Rhizobium sp. P007]CDN95552.1 Rcorf59 [Agrobacterium tumefaciens]SUB56084.1 Uncharacterised protein [Brucella anthropi]